MRIILADDHAMIRQGLRSLLTSLSCYEVIGEVDNGTKAVELAEELNPDLIIMDIVMPEFDGIAATSIIKKRQPGIKIIILSMYSDNSYIRRAFKAGASGYILKEAAFDELRLGMEAIKKGNPYLSSAVLQCVIDEFLHITPVRESQTAYNKLTPREKEVFKLLTKGYNRHAIAKELFISPKTVDQHKQNLKEKLNFHSESDLLRFADQLTSS